MSDEKVGDGGMNGDEQGAEGGQSALAVVTSLMDERRKYESWLEALEAKRDATPARVFTRVHADYTARLDVVLGELTSHSDGLRAELASLTSKLTSLEDERQSQEDERAEAELRAHVGELSTHAWQELAASKDRSLHELTSKHTDLERELTRTRELLNEAERPATPRGAAAVPSEPQPRPEPMVAAAPQSDASAISAPSAKSERDVEESSAAASTESVMAPGASDMPAELTASVIAAEAQLVDQAAAAQNEPAPERRDADVTPRPTQRADASRTSGETAGAFDELAFLSSVVNTPTGTADVPAPTDRGDERARRDSFAQRGPEDDIVNLASGAGTMLEGTAPTRTSPLAMNVTGNIPIVLKDKTTEAAKSLKCGECGSMNYPTEWYCERCGAELASL
jgi:hypothetical protein